MRQVRAHPDGLLLHENLIWSLFPPHVGMRQYWRDLASLESWTRSEPHRAMFSARRRAGRNDTPPPEPVIAEPAYYGD